MGVETKTFFGLQKKEDFFPLSMANYAKYIEKKR
jgi:hypothetical protein